MKITIDVVVSSDNNTCMKMATSSMMIPTNIEGIDSGVQKQDFLTQVETMLRSVSENQVPALYAAVEHVISNTDMETPIDPEKETAVSKQVKKWKKAKKGEQEERPEEMVEAEAVEAPAEEGEAQ